MTANEYLNRLSATLHEERDAELARMREALEQARREAAQQRRDATRWRQEVERLTRQEVTV